MPRKVSQRKSTAQPVEKRRWISRAILVPLIYATVGFALFYALRDTSFLGKIAAEATDKRMRLESDTHTETDTKKFIFIDFDDTTLAERGDPALIPTSDVANILQQLAQTKPWAIFLDIDVTAVPTGKDLNDLVDALKHLDEMKIPVFLDREILSSSNGGAESHFRETPLVPLIAGSSYLAWFSAVSIPGVDGVERRIPAFVSATVGFNGRTRERVPSASLAALLLQRGKSVAEAKKVFNDAMANPTQTCGRPLPPKTIRFCTNPAISITGDNQATIRYTMRWRAPGSLITPLPARSFLRSGELHQSIDPAIFEKNIVIVGSSAADRKDIHQTPLGEMPGSLILANMIRSWLVFAPESDPRFLSGLGLVALATFLGSLIAILTMHYLPERWRPMAKKAIPPFLSVIVWIAFFLLSNLTISIGLIIVLHYVIKIIVNSAHHGVSRGNGTAESNWYL